MEKKMTKKEMFTLIAPLNASNQAIVAFCKHEIEREDNKKSNGNQQANENGVVSTQKVSAMLKKLKEQGKVVSVADKKKTYFRIAD